MEFEKIVLETANRVGYARMNYPPNLNAIDLDMIAEINGALERFAADDDVRVLVLSGLPRCFSAGGDIGYFDERLRSGALGDEMNRLAVELFGLARSIRRLDKPVIASCAGAVAGAGANLALSCDIVICADNARFIQAFVNLGLAADTGGAYLLARDIGWHRTLDLVMTGRPLPADEARQMGLVAQVVAPDALEDATREFAERLARGPAVSYANIKRQVYAAVFTEFDDFGAVEVQTQAECAADDDFTEGVAAFLQKRPPNFR